MKKSRTATLGCVLFSLLIASSHSGFAARGQAPAAPEAASYSREAWLQDYETLKKYLETGYANLEWMQRSKKIDLAALDARTKQALEKSTNATEAKKALEQFLSAFGDAHLGLAEPQKAQQGESGPLVFKASDSGDDVCKALGYRIRIRNFSVPLDKAPGFELLSGERDHFLSGILTLDNGKKYGVLRIPLFSPEGYWQNCRAAWENFRQTVKDNCDGACQNAFGIFAANQLTAALTQQVKAIRAKQVNGVIVDIGGNGGGSDWVEAVVRTIAAKTLRAPSLGFIRHPHWVRQLEQKRGDVEQDLARKDISRQQREILLEASRKLKVLIGEAKVSCDRSSIWTAPSNRRRCSFLNASSTFSTGVLAHAAPGELRGLASYGVLFSPSNFDYQEGVFDGPVVVIVDARTASASEMFAAMLQDNKAAIIVGEPTLGVGCGFTNGGLGLALPNSKLKVWMPDCVRYRKDGTNEAAGIKPDLLIWTKADGKPERAEKFLKALRQL